MTENEPGIPNYSHLAAEGAGFEASSEKEYLVIDGQRSKHETYYEEKMKK